MFIGAFIGLGFQLFEDVLYDYNSAIGGFGADQVNAALGTFALRAGSGIFPTRSTARCSAAAWSMQSARPSSAAVWAWASA